MVWLGHTTPLAAIYKTCTPHNDFSIKFYGFKYCDAFGFNFGASNEDWSLEALDGSNNVLESYILAQTWWSNNGDFFGIATNGISSVRPTQLTNNVDVDTDWILLGNFTYQLNQTDVPEPSVFLLFVIGLIGLTLSRTRKQA